MAIPQAAEAHSPELRRAEGHASGNDGASARPLFRRIQAVHAAGLLPDPRQAGDAGHLRPIPRPWRQRRNHASHGRIAGASGNRRIRPTDLAGSLTKSCKNIRPEVLMRSEFLAFVLLTLPLLKSVEYFYCGVGAESFSFYQKMI